MHILIVTPVPTYPATQGSRQRVRDVGRAFQKQGDIVTLLYWTGELIEPGGAEAMDAAWDDVQTVSSDGHVRHQSHPDHMGIDDWYHDAIGERIAALLRTRRFDACVVNYVWASRALLALPDDCVRIIDMHDLFGDRAARFLEIGRDPDWYHTSIAEERRGLDRADLLIAIQAEEAVQARGRSDREIFDVGFLPRPWPVRARAADGQVVIGYVGSRNGFNIASIEAFCTAVQEVAPMPGLRFVAAGSICEVLETMDGQPFTLLGKVASIADFYAGIDVAINPMLGGTGLKIKTVEALAHGVGVIGTAAAFVGVDTDRPEHRCASVAEMIDRIAALPAAPDAMAALREASRAVFERYVATQEAHFAALHDRIGDLRRTRLEAIAVPSR